MLIKEWRCLSLGLVVQVLVLVGEFLFNGASNALNLLALRAVCSLSLCSVIEALRLFCWRTPLLRRLVLRNWRSMLACCSTFLLIWVFLSYKKGVRTRTFNVHSGHVFLSHTTCGRVFFSQINIWFILRRGNPAQSDELYLTTHRVTTCNTTPISAYALTVTVLDRDPAVVALGLQSLTTFAFFSWGHCV